MFKISVAQLSNILYLVFNGERHEAEHQAKVKLNMKKQIVIIVKRGKVEGYFHSINQQHMVATMTLDVNTAKRFTTVSRAEAFLKKYNNSGYGLDAADARIVTL